MKALFGKLGMGELILILVIALVIFGPSKLPEVGKAMGRALREFRQATREIAEKIEEDESPPMVRQEDKA